jgi:hypothetical protein
MTTEGWVDVMYAASDSVDVYRQPARDANIPMYVFLFPLWIILSFMFLINLAVGLMLNQFDQHSKEGKESLLTDTQRKWINSRRLLFGKKHFFDLTHLHQLPAFQRKVYDMVANPNFDRFIMSCIVANTCIMAATVFPEPVAWWSDAQRVFNYIFAVIFTCEMVLKLVALRSNYWNDLWNRFDFVCVWATLLGIILKVAANLDLGAVTSVVRIMRIARLFRLLRFLKGLNRLFKCLWMSIPKLGNVATIAVLILVLFSILGMNLFGTAKFANDGTMNEHANFQTFFRAFVTLCRASTGEAWNEIMHDLAKDERAFFNDETWCTPQALFKTRDRDVFQVLKDKCLLPETGAPNVCPYDPERWIPFSQIYWVLFTLIVTIMIVNLVVAVILQGYEEGKDTEEADNLEACIEIWKQYDPDRTMSIELKEAVDYINQVMKLVQEQRRKKGRNVVTEEIPPLKGSTLEEVATNLPIKYARIIQMSVTADNQVTLISASRQVLRLCLMERFSKDLIKELDGVGQNMSAKDLAEIERLETKRLADISGVDIASTGAAMKIQQMVRRHRQWKARVSQSREPKREAAVAKNEKNELAGEKKELAGEKKEFAGGPNTTKGDIAEDDSSIEMLDAVTDITNQGAANAGEDVRVVASSDEEVEEADIPGLPVRAG